MAAVYAVGMLLLQAKVIDEVTLGRILPVGMFGVFFLGLATFSARITPGLPGCRGRIITSGLPVPDSRFDRTR